MLLHKRLRIHRTLSCTHHCPKCLSVDTHKWANTHYILYSQSVWISSCRKVVQLEAQFVVHRYQVDYYTIMIRRYLKIVFARLHATSNYMDSSENKLSSKCQQCTSIQNLFMLTIFIRSHFQGLDTQHWLVGVRKTMSLNMSFHIAALFGGFAFDTSLIRQSHTHNA